jgi:16S rRNA (cytidine1402-2'-O)-methyltransferase
LLSVLILAATPIGNLSDASTRLREVLAQSEHIAAEDTRTLKQLASALGIRLAARLYSLHEHSDAERTALLVEVARDHDLLVVSDAGMPTISDPGYQLVRDCAQAGIEIIAIPGPSAVISALAVSGLPTDRFSFEGFLPRKQGERLRVFEALKDEARTMVFFEAPHRIHESLVDAVTVFGAERPGTVSRELTKKFEHTERGSLSELVTWAAGSPKGEMVMIIGGASPKTFDVAELGLKALELAASGLGLKQACADLAEATGASKSAIYAEALLHKP